MAENKLDPGTRVQSERFGQGRVEYDKGVTVIVRFHHGIEECERSSLKLIRSVEDSIRGGNWDPGLPVVAKALASAIVSVNDTWGVFPDRELHCYRISFGCVAVYWRIGPRDGWWPMTLDWAKPLRQD